MLCGRMEAAFQRCEGPHERVRRAMPRNPDVMALCDLLDQLIPVTKPPVTKPADTFVTRFKTSRPTIGDIPLSQPSASASPVPAKPRSEKNRGIRGRGLE